MAMTRLPEQAGVTQSARKFFGKLVLVNLEYVVAPKFGEGSVPAVSVQESIVSEVRRHPMCEPEPCLMRIGQIQRICADKGLAAPSGSLREFAHEYRPHAAEGSYLLRRQRLAALETDAKLATYVTDRLAEGWTPEQIAGRLRART